MATLRVLIASTLILAACLHPALAAPQHYPAQDYSFGEWMEKLQPVLQGWPSVEDPAVPEGEPGRWKNPPFDWQHKKDFLFNSEGTGPAADLATIPGGGALKPAALYYTLATGDLSASIGELEAGGWWPYATLPAGLDRTLCVVQGEGGGTIRSKYEVLKHIGEPAWLLSAKGEVLRDFYTDFFFRSEKTMRSASALPARVPAFWVNPFTGEPTRESERPGDLKLEDVSRNYIGNGGHHPIELDWKSGERPPSEAAARKEARVVAQFNWLRRDDARPWHELAGTAIPLLPQHFRSSDHGMPRDFEDIKPYEPRLRHAGAVYLGGLKDILVTGKVGLTLANLSDVTLDDSGERAPLEDLPCPLALQLAAKYYAMATLDNQVSLRDLVDSGFWPYDTFPSHLDLSETLYGFPRNIRVDISFAPEHVDGMGNVHAAHWKGLAANNLGTREWLLWRKAEILNQAHAELYFMPDRMFLPAEGVDPAVEPVRPRFAAFWGDVLRPAEDGTVPPLAFSGDIGQLSTIDVNWLRPQFEGARLSYKQQVPLLNLNWKQSPPVGTPWPLCGLYAKRSIDIGGVEQSAAWRMPPEAGGGVAEVRWVCGPADSREDLVLLDFGWLDRKYANKTAEEAVKAYGHGGMNARLALVPQGASPGDVLFGGFWLGGTARVIYDGVAPLRARFGWKWSYPPDYGMVSQLGSPSLAQVQGVPCGIDWLAEAAPTTLASLE